LKINSQLILNSNPDYIYNIGSLNDNNLLLKKSITSTTDNFCNYLPSNSLPLTKINNNDATTNQIISFNGS